MAQVQNFYNKAKDFIKDKSYNPNKAQGALIHPFRCAVTGFSGSGKGNTICNIINISGCFRKITLVAMNAKEEPLYRFLAAKLGDKLEILEDVDDLPHLQGSLKTKASSGKEKVEKKKKKKIEESSGSESSGSESESDSSSKDKKSEKEDSSSDDEGVSFEKKVGKQQLIIFDDVLFEGKDMLRKISNYFVQGRHHNLSCIITAQNWYALPRTVRLNCNYIIITKLNSLRDVKAIISDASLGVKPELLVKIYETATDAYGNFLLIDLVDPDPTHRFRKGFAEAIIPPK